jgi:hypothetical protein
VLSVRITRNGSDSGSIHRASKWIGSALAERFLLILVNDDGVRLHLSDSGVLFDSSVVGKDY